MNELSKHPEEGPADDLRQRIRKGLSRYDAENPAKYLEISTETANIIGIGLEDATKIANEIIELYPESLTDDPDLINTYRQILNSYGFQLESLLTIGILEFPEGSSAQNNLQTLINEAKQWADELLASEIQKRGSQFLRAAGAVQAETVEGTQSEISESQDQDD